MDWKINVHFIIKRIHVNQNRKSTRSFGFHAKAYRRRVIPYQPAQQLLAMSNCFAVSLSGTAGNGKVMYTNVDSLLSFMITSPTHESFPISHVVLIRIHHAFLFCIRAANKLLKTFP